ncbi:MAG: Aminomethyltransferase [Alphaproteobacteria bacterium MarineAlpha9_Bin7]|nr:MAG: Aminomethyltransferase [Alphaproteobacteria bacterium MarineAlpha9_Bin7]
MHARARVRLSENQVSQKKPVNRSLKQTPLCSLHKTLGARMGTFAGFDMPINYPTGIIAEHRHCRTAASLFDVSHMSQFCIRGSNGLAEIAAALELMVPGDIQGLRLGQLRYTMLTNDQGGVIDDVIVARVANHFHLIGNASRSKTDKKILCDKLPASISVTQLDRALIALQGPKAEEVLVRHMPKLRTINFMYGNKFELAGAECWVSRSGYTGEDGFEISVPANQAVEVAELILDEEEVKPAGLGARDSLRLEAGLCLYGHDLNETITPIEAGLHWTISRRRRAQKNFPGAHKILHQLIEGPKQQRIGLQPAGNILVREGAKINDTNGNNIGTVTSGGFGPTIGGPIAVGYIAKEKIHMGACLKLRVRNKEIEAAMTSLPFVQHRYRK